MRSQSHPHRLARSAATVLAVTAIAVPAAVARPMLEPQGSGPASELARPADTRETAAAANPRAPTVVRTIDDGFDWASAGIGAAGAAAIVLLSLGGAQGRSRAGIRTARRSPTTHQRRVP